MCVCKHTAHSCLHMFTTCLVAHLLADLLTTDVGTNGTACLIGVLQTLRNILPVLCNHADELSSSLPRNVYSFLLSCLTDTEDHNVVTSALEALQVLLQLVPTLQVRLLVCMRPNLSGMGLCLVWSILLCQHMCFLHSGLSFLLNTPGSHQCVIADVAIGHCALTSCCPTQLPHLLSNTLPFSAQHTHCTTVAVPLPNSQSVLPSSTSFTKVMVVPCGVYCLVPQSLLDAQLLVWGEHGTAVVVTLG